MLGLVFCTFCMNSLKRIMYCRLNFVILPMKIDITIEKAVFHSIDCNNYHWDSLEIIKMILQPIFHDYPAYRLSLHIVFHLIMTISSVFFVLIHRIIGIVFMLFSLKINFWNIKLKLIVADKIEYGTFG